MAVVMVAMLAFGGTYAYFTASATGWTSGEKFKTATVNVTSDGISELEEITAVKLLPGQTVVQNASVTIKSTSDVAIYVFVKFSAAADHDYQVYINENSSKPMIAITGTNAEWLTDDDLGEGVYYVALTAEEAATFSKAFTFNVALDIDIQSDNVQGTGEVTNVYYENEENEKVFAPVMGLDIAVTLEIAAVQQYGFNDVEDADPDTDGDQPKSAIQQAYEAAFTTVVTDAEKGLDHERA